MGEKPRKIGRFLSPVDYEAWEKGYMPPSEHVLIDALAYRGARVAMSTQANDFGVWLVVKGGTVPKGARKVLMEAIHDTLEFMEGEVEKVLSEELPAALSECLFQYCDTLDKCRTDGCRHPRPKGSPVAPGA